MNDIFKFRIFDNEFDQYINPDETEYYIDSNGRVILEVESITENGVVVLKEIDITDENDSYIVERCTGLLDKNGRLIYEGDKIRFEDADIEGVIVFCKGAFCFKWKSKTFLFHHIAENIAGQIDNHDMVVVGNIHEVEK